MQNKIFSEAQVKEIREALLSEKTQSFISATKGAPEGAQLFKMVITSEDVDRMGETIVMAGWQLDNYLANPVVLWAHDYKSLPVGITTKLTIEGKKMIAEGYFAPAEANPNAGYVAKLYELGLLKSSSVGFIPTYDEKDKTKIIGAELLEWSFTPVPANPHALDVMKGANLEVASFKGFLGEESKENEEVEEKGAVTDILNAEEMRDMKYENLDEFFDIVYAFCNAYMDDKTPVESFSGLLDETIGLLQQLSAGTLADPDEQKSVNVKAMKEIGWRVAAEEFMNVKSGRVLSEKNKKLILSAIGKLDETGQALKDLVASAESDTEPTQKAATHKQSGEDGEQPIMEAQKVLRSVTTVLQGALRDMKLKAEKKEAK